MPAHTNRKVLGHAFVNAQTPPASAPQRMSWGCLLKRVFDLDVERCTNCGGRLKITAAIVDPAVMTKILTHMHLPARTATLSGAASRSVASGLIAHSSCLASGLATSRGSRSPWHSRKRQNGADSGHLRR